MQEFTGKVAVITGAAGGIGRGIAERCVQEGMKVVLADVEEAALAQTERELKASGATSLAGTDGCFPGKRHRDPGAEDAQGIWSRPSAGE